MLHNESKDASFARYTVNISLPKQLADAAHKQVKSGYYGSLSEVVRDALRRLLLSSVPTTAMNTKAEQIAKKARQEYDEDNLSPMTSINDIL